MNQPAVHLGFPGLNRILVVDDEPALLRLTEETLNLSHYTVRTTASPSTALELIQHEEFGVILSDQRMPVMTGLELLKQVKQLRPNITRLLMTGFTEVDVLTEAINTGEVFRFMIKPWLPMELVRLVGEAMDHYQDSSHKSGLENETLKANEKLRHLSLSLAEQVQRCDEQNQQLATLNAALEQSLQSSIDLCMKIMRTFNPTLANQAYRVQALTRAMALVLKLPPAQQQVLELSALLHDIGLIGAPRDIVRRLLEAPKSLSEAQLLLIRHHPITGQGLVNFGHHLAEVGLIIRAHHERMDGTGYPDELGGERIPWLGRLLAVAVGYTESRYEGDGALRDVESLRGTAYDPEAVRVLARALPQAVLPRKERSVLLSELRPGMVLAKALHNATGILILPEEKQLSQAWIEKLYEHDQVSPLDPAVQVYC